MNGPLFKTTAFAALDTEQQLEECEKVNAELLEALKDLEYAVRHDLPCGHQLDAARAAIAKANKK